MQKRSPAFVAFSFFLCSSLVACGGGGGGSAGGGAIVPSATPTVSPTPVVTSAPPGPSAVSTIGTSSATFTLAASGFQAALTLPGASSGAGAKVTATLSTTPPGGITAPQLRRTQTNAHAGVVFVAFTTSSPVTLAGTLTGTFAVPHASPSQQYYVAIYSPGRGWTYDLAGPSSPSSNGVVAFTVQIPASSPLNLTPGSTYALALTTDTALTTISVAFSTVPTAIATQIGNGAWQSTSPSGTSLTFALPQGATTFGIAYVCPSVNSVTSEYVIQSTTADGTSVTAPCPSAAASAPARVKVSGAFDVSAIPGATTGTISFGNVTSNANNVNGGVGTYGALIPAGTYDVVALATAHHDVLGATILRNQSILTNETLDVPPFATADETTTYPINLPATLPGFTPFESVNFVTAGGTSATVSDQTLQNSYAALPQSALQSGDYYDSKYTQFSLSTSQNESIEVESTFATAAPLTVNVPSNPQFVAVVPAASPVFTFDNASLPAAPYAYDSGTISYGLSSVTAFVSKNWIGSANSYALPALSSLPGFAAAPPSGTSVSWSQSSVASTAPLNASSATSGLPANASATTLLNFGYYSVP